ncbi:Ribosomal protein S18 acetylase RimI [Gracilibacillus ureilyticus]|uniref:Ribosomal protein S18 acetylase RimI n=1 Tax=Gracilibacillus ureilyticus TaxID=531814 RepID=A0A1H9V908_9BACI|nr:GNAT family N-acetyltransferase [Gracilibacillus ureilyticus]SES18330.1 Ribosomal protein S18 acetylase RimI [Gracilibacillus ureilyticus]
MRYSVEDEQMLVKEMDEKSAREILSWRYEQPYDLYNNEATEESLNELLDGSYKVVILHDGTVFGFFCTGKMAQVPAGHNFGAYNDNCVDVDLGMNPDYTGKGNGYTFCSFIIEFVARIFPNIPVRLTVATFNKRAIHLYEKLGFEKKNQFSNGSTEFITMLTVCQTPTD